MGQSLDTGNKASGFVGFLDRAQGPLHEAAKRRQNAVTDNFWHINGHRMLLKVPRADEPKERKKLRVLTG